MLSAHLQPPWSERARHTEKKEANCKPHHCKCFCSVGTEPAAALIHLLTFLTPNFWLRQQPGLGGSGAAQDSPSPSVCFRSRSRSSSKCGRFLFAEHGEPRHGPGCAAGRAPVTPLPFSNLTQGHHATNALTSCPSPGDTEARRAGTLSRTKAHC